MDLSHLAAILDIPVSVLRDVYQGKSFLAGKPAGAIKILPQVGVIGHTQVSMVNDTPHGEDGVYFNTTNEDRVQTSAVPMIEVNDIISLPKGQAFVLVNGGELYKVRIPLPLNDGLAPTDIKQVIRQINQLPNTLQEKTNASNH